MATELAIRSDGADVMERVVTAGDLGKLTPEDRVRYYGEVCRSLGLNPLSRPFQYITLQGRLTLYATRDATDQLRRLHNVTVQIVSRERVEDVWVVTARATMGDRSDESVGAVTIGALKGDALANALMKAETKSKRRVTLSIVGLGWLDETEVETVPDARRVVVDDTGEIVHTAHATIAEEEPSPLAAPQAVKCEVCGVSGWTNRYTALPDPDREGHALWYCPKHTPKR